MVQSLQPTHLSSTTSLAPAALIRINAAGAKDVVDDKCVGCKLCTIACPYGTIFYDPDTTKAYKCNLCEGHPACADACPTEAITFVEGQNADWIGDFAAERTTRVLTRETA